MFKKKPEPFYFPCQEIPLQKMDKWRYLDMTTRRQLKVASGRMGFIAFWFLLAYAVIIGRLFYLTVMNYEPRLFKNSVQTAYVLNRHNIVDRNGIILATSLPTTDLSVDPALVKGDPKEIAEKIHSALPDIDAESIFNKITSNAGFKYIKRNLTPKERSAINWLGYYFLAETKGEKRVYPQGSLVAHLLGGVDIDNIGISGIEKAYDTELMEREVQLSIDASIQEMAKNALQQGIEKFKAKGGLALVMDVHNGEILASVSMPDYDPNVSAGKAGKERFNQATLGTYEFGSVFKLFNTALGLETKTITVNDIFDASNPLKLKGAKAIEDYRGQNRPLTVPEILIHSSNIGSAQIGLKIGWENQKEFFGRFGFYDKLPIALPERGQPLYIKKDKWNEVESSRLSYGYGISVTPLHLIAGVASLVNGGFYRTPTFIKGGNVGKPEMRVVSEETSQKMRHMMWAVVNYELPKNSPVALYAVGGKTGSRQALENGHYVEGSLRTTFVGVFPMNDPKYIVLISYDDPQKVKATYMFNTAGWNAKATGLQLIGDIAPYLGIAPVEEWKQPAYIERAFERSLAYKKRK